MTTAQRILGVLGPTACGKTSLALTLADRFGAEIVSVDSRQVYAGLDIGTGKDLDEYVRHPGVHHHLIDIVSPAGRTYPMSLVEWLDRARTTLETLRARQILPLLAGGTSLYWKALLEDYQPPEAPPDRAFRQAARRFPPERLAAELQSRFPGIAAVTRLSSARRVIRALEIGRARGDFAPGRAEGLSERYRPFLIRVTADRDTLRQRIRRRLLERLDEGLVQEVRNLLASGVHREFLHRLGLEYRFVSLYLDGSLSHDAMVDALLRHICRFAKAQETWIRSFEKRGWPMAPFAVSDAPERLFPAVEAWLSGP